MGAAALILLLSLVPSVLSLVMLKRARQRWQTRMYTIRQRYSVIYQSQPRSLPGSRLPNYLGNIGCEYNAKSPYLRCAVNPEGPCEDCRFFSSRNLGN